MFGSRAEMKTIELKDVETHEQYEFLLNEIEIMKKLDHPNIARFASLWVGFPTLADSRRLLGRGVEGIEASDGSSTIVIMSVRYSEMVDLNDTGL